MKKLEIIIGSEKLDDLKVILDTCNAPGMMIYNIMGFGHQRGHRKLFKNAYTNLLPKIKVETIVTDEIAEKIVERVVKELKTGDVGDGKVFIYELEDCVRIRTGERGESAL